MALVLKEIATLVVFQGYHILHFGPQLVGWLVFFFLEHFILYVSFFVALLVYSQFPILKSVIRYNQSATLIVQGSYMQGMLKKPKIENKFFY